jgi:hypothetical protein
VCHRRLVHGRRALRHDPDAQAGAGGDPEPDRRHVQDVGRALSLPGHAGVRSYWADLVNLLGAPELKNDPRFIDSTARRENAAECVHALDDLFAKKTFEEWKTILQDAKGIRAPVQNAA